MDNIEGSAYVIQITSTLRVKEEHRADALELALEHVATSRQEDGCISHEVYLHPEDPDVLFFYEQWRDQEAIDMHFRQEGSQKLVTRMKQWAAAPMALTLARIETEQQQPVG